MFKFEIMNRIGSHVSRDEFLVFELHSTSFMNWPWEFRVEVANELLDAERELRDSQQELADRRDDESRERYRNAIARHTLVDKFAMLLLY
jgi:hypothetical protein